MEVVSRTYRVTDEDLSINYDTNRVTLLGENIFPVAEAGRAFLYRLGAGYIQRTNIAEGSPIMWRDTLYWTIARISMRPTGKVEIQLALKPLTMYPRILHFMGTSMEELKKLSYSLSLIKLATMHDMYSGRSISLIDTPHGSPTIHFFAHTNKEISQPILPKLTIETLQDLTDQVRYGINGCHLGWAVNFLLGTAVHHFVAEVGDEESENVVEVTMTYTFTSSGEISLTAVVYKCELEMDAFALQHLEDLLDGIQVPFSMRNLSITSD